MKRALPFIIFILGIVMLGTVLISAKDNSSSTPTVAEQTQPTPPPVQQKPQYPDAQEIHKLVNEYRASKGVPALNWNDKLQKSSAAKCDDMIKNDYFDHTSPQGKDPWAFFSDAGYYYDGLYAGENLMYGVFYSSVVLQRWENSPGHNANLINPNFKDEGITVCISPNYMRTGVADIIVQHLGKEQVQKSAQQSNADELFIKKMSCLTLDNTYFNEYQSTWSVWANKVFSLSAFSNARPKMVADANLQLDSDWKYYAQKEAAQGCHINFQQSFIH